jgi:hypothetical protein
MSNVAVNSGIGPETAEPAIGVGLTPPRPWAFWTTLAWGVIGIALAREGPYALPYCIEYCVRFWNWIEPSEAFAWHRGVWWQLAVFSLAGFFLIGASVRGAWASGCPVRQYLGLVLPSRRDVILGLAVVIGLLLMLMVAVTWYVFQAPNGSAAAHSFFSSGTTATLLLMWPAGVVIAPVSEELMFRGFLFRDGKKRGSVREEPLCSLLPFGRCCTPTRTGWVLRLSSLPDFSWDGCVGAAVPRY